MKLYDVEITCNDRPITVPTVGILRDGLDMLVDPQKGHVWTRTQMRWVDVGPIFEFILHGLDLGSGKVEFLSAPDEMAFYEQLGWIKDRDIGDELYPDILFPKRIANQIRSGQVKIGIPVWFTGNKVNVLWGDNPYYHEWSISTIYNDPDTLTLYNPVRVDRVTFQRSREGNFSESFPTTFS